MRKTELLIPAGSLDVLKTAVIFGADAKIDDIPVTEIAEYVQKDSNKYISKFLHRII